MGVTCKIILRWLSQCGVWRGFLYIYNRYKESNCRYIVVNEKIHPFFFILSCLYSLPQETNIRSSSCIAKTGIALHMYALCYNSWMAYVKCRWRCNLYNMTFFCLVSRRRRNWWSSEKLRLDLGSFTDNTRLNTCRIMFLWLSQCSVWRVFFIRNIQRE